MSYKIQQTTASDATTSKIIQGFADHAIKQIGVSEFTNDEYTSFEIHEDDKLVGVAVCLIFWKQLHVKYLFVDEAYRGKGIGTLLLNRALEFGKSHNCQDVFLQTMSFQAPEFYKNLGFIMEFTRAGYQHGVSLHYLRKSLK